MFRLHDGWDYALYRAYIGLGLTALIGAPILVALIYGDGFPYTDYSKPYMLGLTGWIFGILLYWWWVFLFKEARVVLFPGSPSALSPPPLKALKNLTSLHQAMTVHGGDVESGRMAHQAGKGPVLEFFGWTNLLVLWILGAAWAGMLELFPQVDPIVVPVGVVIIALVLVSRIYFTVGRSQEGFVESYLEPLGLSAAQNLGVKLHLLGFLTGGQRAIPTGAAVIEGQRFGRPIRIELRSQLSHTQVPGNTPQFTLLSVDGRLVPENEAPEAVNRALKGLRKARRWRGIRVEGGPEGITIDRETRQQNMWLYDLWLAEHLLEMLDDHTL